MFLRIRSCVATYTQVVKRHAPAHVPHFGKVKYRQWNCINENANKYKSDVGNQGSNQWHQNQGFSPTVLEIKYIFRLGCNILTILLYRRVLRQSSRKSQPVLYQQNPCTTEIQNFSQCIQRNDDLSYCQNFSDMISVAYLYLVYRTVVEVALKNSRQLKTYWIKTLKQSSVR